MVTTLILRHVRLRLFYIEIITPPADVKRSATVTRSYGKVRDTFSLTLGRATTGNVNRLVVTAEI